MYRYCSNFGCLRGTEHASAIQKIPILEHKIGPALSSTHVLSIWDPTNSFPRISSNEDK